MNAVSWCKFKTMSAFRVFLVYFTAYCADWTFGQYTYNYCSPDLCYGSNHIACGNNAEYGPHCSPDSELLDLTSYRHIIADRHNQYRDEVAGGNLPGFSPATRMATMQYDEELEYLASLNVLRCTSHHDDCRNTDRFPQSGQNLAYRWDPSGQVPNAINAVLWALDYWFSENVDADMSLVNNYYEGRGAEHFLVMIAEKNVAVGCGALQTVEKGGISTFVACNYATTNIIGRPIYRHGQTPGSHCQLGGSYDYTNLCDITERYSFNTNYW